LRELGRLVWADLHLNETRPYLIARADTTKNEGDDARTVFSVKLHPERHFKNDPPRREFNLSMPLAGNWVSTRCAIPSPRALRKKEFHNGSPRS
jgi:hypothetical protein